LSTLYGDSLVVSCLLVSYTAIFDSIKHLSICDHCYP